LKHTASPDGRPWETAGILSKCLHLQEFMRRKIKENYSTFEGFAGANPTSFQSENPSQNLPHGGVSIGISTWLAPVL